MENSRITTIKQIKILCVLYEIEWENFLHQKKEFWLVNVSHHKEDEAFNKVKKIANEINKKLGQNYLIGVVGYIKNSTYKTIELKDFNQEYVIAKLKEEN